MLHACCYSITASQVCLALGLMCVFTVIQLFYVCIHHRWSHIGHTSYAMENTSDNFMNYEAKMDR